MMRPRTGTASETATELPLQSLIDQRLLPIRTAPVQPSGTGAWTGPFRGIRHGHGLDFDDLRPYTDGDDLRRIDWKVSARRNLTHTRLYREEKDHVLSLGLDLRRSLFNGSSELRSVTAGRMAARLCWHASRGGSRVRLFTLSDAGIHSTRARAGELGALEACGLISERFDVGRRLADPSLAQTLDEFLAYLTRQGRQLGSVILLSGMEQTGDAFDQRLGTLASSRPTAAILLDDPMLVQGLQPGRYAWRSGSRIRQITLNTRRSQQLREQLAEHRRQIIDRFVAQRVPLCSTTDGVDNILLALQQAAFLP